MYEPLGQKKQDVKYRLYVPIQAGPHTGHHGQRGGQGELGGEY